MTTHSSIDAATGPHAVKAIRGLLPNFSPVDKPVGDTDSITLAFDIWHWTFNPNQPPPCPNAPIGTLTVQRQASAHEVHYQINQQTNVGGGANHLNAHILCHPDDPNTLKSWEITTHHQTRSGHDDPRLTLEESGQNDAGNLRIQTGENQTEYQAQNPVISQWTLLHFLMAHASKSTQITFDLLQDLSLFKPNQSLYYDAQIEINLQDNQPLTLNTYAQTGVGIQPIHYLLDAQNRPQLITFSILTWALKDIV